MKSDDDTYNRTFDGRLISSLDGTTLKFVDLNTGEVVRSVEGMPANRSARHISERWAVLLERASSKMTLPELYDVSGPTAKLVRQIDWSGPGTLPSASNYEEYVYGDDSVVKWENSYMSGSMRIEDYATGVTTSSLDEFRFAVHLATIGNEQVVIGIASQGHAVAALRKDGSIRWRIDLSDAEHVSDDPKWVGVDRGGRHLMFISRPSNSEAKPWLGIDLELGVAVDDQPSRSDTGPAPDLPVPSGWQGKHPSSTGLWDDGKHEAVAYYGLLSRPISTPSTARTATPFVLLDLAGKEQWRQSFDAAEGDDVDCQLSGALIACASRTELRVSKLDSGEVVKTIPLAKGNLSTTIRAADADVAVVQEWSDPTSGPTIPSTIHAIGLR